MASAFCIQTYRIYKKQTDQIAQWLLDTAEKCGYRLKTKETKTESPTPVPQTSGRLKGKARKEARERLDAQQSSQSSSPDATDPPLFRIRLPQFAELARAIVDSGKSKVTVPNTFVQLVQHTVKMRKRISSFYEMQAAGVPNDDLLKEENSNHLHFISKLEEVLEILKPRFAPFSRTSVPLRHDAAGGTGKPGSTQSAALENRFSSLQVEEPPEVELDSNPPTHTSGLGKPEKPTHHRKVVYDTQGVDEIFFAAFCLFDDLQQVRTTIQSIWENYKSGILDLSTASVTTNAALEMVKHADEEICRMFPEPSMISPFENMSGLLFGSTCLANGIDINFRHDRHDFFNYQMADVGLFVYLPTYAFLRSFCRTIRSPAIPQPSKGIFGIYNPKSDRSKMSFRQKLSEDDAILRELLPEFYLLEKSNVEGFGFDDFTKGLRTMFQTKEVPLWLAFAAQVFLDINHVLRDQVGRGLFELKEAGEAARPSLVLALTAPAHSPNWPKICDIVFESALSFINEWIASDRVDELKREFYGTRYGIVGPQPYNLLSRHPLLCGSMVFSLTLLLREQGAGLAVAWTSISQVAHLYNTFRQTGRLDILWPDMERFISINTVRSIFIGDYPTTAADCVKRYELMLGLSAKHFAKSRGGGFPVYKKGKGLVIERSKNGPRKWLLEPPVVGIFRDRYLKPTSTNWAANNIGAMLNETSPLSFLQPLRDRWDKTQHLDMPQLLILLQCGVAYELPSLRYNYLAMHFRCLDLLRALRPALDKDLRNRFAVEFTEREDKLTSIAGCFMTATSAAGAVGPFRGPGSVAHGTAMSIRGGDVMKKFIESAEAVN